MHAGPPLALYPQSLLDSLRFLLYLDGVLGLQHCLHILVPLKEPLGVVVPLSDVLLPSTVDPLEKGLKLFKADDPARSPCE